MRVGTETYHYDSLIKHHFFCLFARRAKIRLSLMTSPKMDPTYLILLISIPPRDTVSTEAP